MASQSPAGIETGSSPLVVFILDLNDLGPRKRKIDIGPFYKRFEFKGMMNGGYIVYGRFLDSSFRVYNALIKRGYFQKTRREPLKVTFQIKYGKNATGRKTTKRQVAYITSVRTYGKSNDASQIEFFAVDPASYYLNYGDASGAAYKGRLDQIMRQVVTDYTKNIKVEVSKTTDSDQNKWWMLRQDPQSFLVSLADWSASVTQKKTHWLFASDGLNFTIKEQALWVSRQRAYYRRTNKANDILEWNIFADNSLTAVNTKIITQGASAVSGLYLDRVTDKQEQQVFAKDSTTSNKQIALTNKDRTFSKPDDAKPPKSGWTSVQCIPEIYSAGEIGIDYNQYIDGRARAMYLNMTTQLLRMKITVRGSGTWADTNGLGVDTVFLNWTIPSTNDITKLWWPTGNWIVYGFHHRVDQGKWFVDLSLARFDHDAQGVKVGNKNKSRPRSSTQSNTLNSFN